MTAVMTRAEASLGKRLALEAGLIAGSARFTLTVNTTSDRSWWSHRSRRMQIGLKGFAEEEALPLGRKLMKHEVGHLLHTSPHISAESLAFPFTILNILEDAREEQLMDEDFGPLHARSYRVHYSDAGEEERFRNPFNVGVLYRWRKWGVAAEPKTPAELSSDEADEFLRHWQEAIDRSIDAPATEEVLPIGLELYERWKSLFDKYDDPSLVFGLSEQSAKDMLGDGEDDNDRGGGGDGRSDTQGREDHFGDEVFQWDMAYIRDQAEMLRKLIEPRAGVERQYSLTGRRFDPRRIDNPPLVPFRRVLPADSDRQLRTMLVVIDGSASMSNAPFQAAAHLAHILSLVFPVDIRITTSESASPIPVALHEIDLLTRFLSWGGSENYVSLAEVPSAYQFTLFLTDAMVGEEDKDYVASSLVRMTRAAAGYVGRGSERLDDVFPRNFYSEALDQNIARMVALFLRRTFPATLSDTRR